VRALLAEATEEVKIMKLIKIDTKKVTDAAKPFIGVVTLSLALLLLAVAIAGCFTSAPANSEPVYEETFQTEATDFLHKNPHFNEVYDGNGLKVHMDNGGDGYGHRTLLFTYTFGGKDNQQHAAQVYVCGVAPCYVVDAIMDENYDLINDRYIK
jgi:hypothetical protein